MSEPVPPPPPSPTPIPTDPKPLSRARRAWQFFLPLAIFVTLAVFFYKGLFLNPREIPSALIGKPVPAFALPMLHEPGRMVTPADMKGQVWVMNVWASWCVSCRYEHPFLNELAKQQVVPIVGFNWKDETNAAKGWLKKHGDPYQFSMVDMTGRSAIDFGVYGAPETFVIDRAGVIRYKHTGPMDAVAVNEKLLPVIRDLQKQPRQGS